MSQSRCQNKAYWWMDADEGTTTVNTHTHGTGGDPYTSILD